MTRLHRRRLVIPAVATALALPTGLLLASCSAGQLAETSMVTSSVPGAQATVRAGEPDETIQVANATIDYNGPKGYAAGDDAPLSLWIFNNTGKDITLTEVRSDAGQISESAGAAAGAPSVCQASAKPVQANPSTGAPTAGVAPSMGASGGISPQGPTATASNASSAKPTSSATPGGSGSPSPNESGSAEPGGSATPSPSTPAGSTEINITIKANGCVALTRQSSQFLQIDNLAAAITPGKTVNMAFTFQQAGGGQFAIGSQNSPIAIPVDVPGSPDMRAPAVPAPSE